MALLVSVTVSVGAWGASIPEDGTQLSRLREDGLLLLVSTGTSGGQCVSAGNAISCFDGGSYALADLVAGCGPHGGDGYCIIARPSDLEADLEVEGTTESPLESKIDVKCGSGSMKGTIFTVGDGDGSGSCGPDRGVDGRFIGATCTKNGSECTNVSCDNGCTSASANCTCAIKREPGASPRL